jgi:hypothetical protein
MLDHSRRTDIDELALKLQITFTASGREIKWNGSGFIAGRADVATFRFFRTPHLELVLYCGPRMLAAGTDPSFAIEGLDHAWADRTRSAPEVPTGEAIDRCVTALGSWLAVLVTHGSVETRA